MRQIFTAEARKFRIDQRNIHSNLKTIISDLPEKLSQKVLGACLYEYVDSDNVVAVSNAEGPRSDHNHHAFLNKDILNKRIYVPSTSVGQSVKETKKSKGQSDIVSIYDSGFDSSHICVNLPIKHSRFDYSVLQLAFKENSSFSGGIISQDEKNYLQGKLSELSYNSGLRAALPSFHKTYVANEKLEDVMALEDVTSIEGFLMFVDVTGSAKIENEYQHPETYGFLGDYRHAVTEIAGQVSGRQLRGGGDDLWLMFPASEMSEEQRSGLFTKKIMPVVQEIMHEYDVFKKAHNAEIIQETKLKVTVDFGSNIIYQDSNKNIDVMQLEGKPFYRVNALAEGISGNDRYNKSNYLVFNDSIAPYAQAVIDKIEKHGSEVLKTNPYKKGQIRDVYVKTFDL